MPDLPRWRLLPDTANSLCQRHARPRDLPRALGAPEPLPCSGPSNNFGDVRDGREPARLLTAGAGRGRTGRIGSDRVLGLADIFSPISESAGTADAQGDGCSVAEDARLQAKLIDAERAAIAAADRDDEITDDAHRRIERELDLEDARNLQPIERATSDRLADPESEVKG